MGTSGTQSEAPGSFVHQGLGRVYDSFPKNLTLLVIVAVLALGACSDTVDPFIESDRRFSLYGMLEMDRDTQYVRVVPVTLQLEPSSEAPLDVTFTSRDLVTDDVVVWRDSLMQLGGEWTHIFWAPLRIQASHTYRIEVDGMVDDVVTQLETTAPDRISGEVLAENLTLSPVNGTPPGTQRVRWPNLDREPFRVELWYRFLDRIEAPFIDVLSPAGAVLVPPAPGSSGWDVRVDLREDREQMRDVIDIESNALMGLGVEITLLDAAFQPPGGVFDPDLLSQPGTFSNVENGFGFVGIVGRYSVEWVLSDETLAELGYRSSNDLFGKTASRPGSR
ncbi:MAG: hypothetical protein R3178_06080 [Rhodothermales bacterium]|nr:hypothetical protein [Rhodothermales bacterium]